MEHLRWKNLGKVLCGGVMDAGDAQGRKELDDARELKLQDENIMACMELRALAQTRMMVLQLRSGASAPLLNVYIYHRCGQQLSKPGGR